jgi:hypothetical protein
MMMDRLYAGVFPTIVLAFLLLPVWAPLVLITYAVVAGGLIVVYLIGWLMQKLGWDKYL